ncbi:flagellar basal body rod protein FlgB [Acetobacter orientalis]|uniref:Flagellar basal-body rod protein FlgB n=2 Tax=Acetobacter orientalis TaxID=146474 RepID=A0A2Z5ZE40_9PROT|nr:flagellar basal body protein [Acetobacter orientalis]GBR16560.1 flagellar basal-body rod protein FlgB [Acetobacter orientalis NRIC 0481]MCP1222696.1 flagellar basal body protein [Acetobacter orientalis]BBC78972.1 flagellar basal-body rod protein FlgB [Acetobacter orientalis]GAN66254.1 flagellar basal-body rod protein FlgB [Acetobacter orientalis]GEL62033.1 flagellar biosynthesis protein FlgB [Acetobacter orientalis]
MLEALSSHAMSSSNGTDLLGLAERRLTWLEKRQSVLAGNVANADTPGYVAKDVSPFQGVLQNQMAVTLAQTEPGHLSGNNGTAHAAATGGNISISGNEVKLEDQLEKVADTNDQQRLATTLYSRYTSMISTVLGSGS